MFSPRLIQLVETNWKRIAESAAQAIRADPRAPSYGQMAESELFDRSSEVLQNLGWWLVEADWDELHRRYVALGQLRKAQGVPAVEVVRKLQILKRVLCQFLEDQRTFISTVEIHAEYDLLKAVNSFFDETVYAVLKGYSLQEDLDQERQAEANVA
jgi:hypothetical protein